MTRHDSHLPRQELNKGISAKDAKTTDRKTLGRVAKAQGTTTKQDAKDARRTK